VKRNVAILHYAAPPIIGGVESTIFHHARLLSRSGYDVTIIAGRGEPFQSGIRHHHLPEVDSRHPEVLDIGEKLASGAVPDEFHRLLDVLYFRLRQILKDVQVLIVHNAITLHKNLALTAALRRIGDDGDIRIIAWCHDFAWQDALYTPDLHPGYPWDLLRFPWPGVQYVAVSEHRRERLASLLGLKRECISVVTPGVDVGAFLKLEALTRDLVDRLDLLDADPLILLPARITRRKNIEFAVRVVASLKAAKPKALLMITGPPGPHNPKNIAYLQSLNDLKESLNVVENVCFLYEQNDRGGPLRITDEVVADLYRLADLLLFPSKREGFGIPVLEAGLARLLVFAADIPPVHESSGGFVHLFDLEETPEKVAVEMGTCIDQDQAYQLRHRVLQHFTWNSIVNNQLIPLLES